MDEVGLPLAPTFVAFTPWTSVRGYAHLLRTVERLGLVGHVAPVQYAIRLLVPSGSRLLELSELNGVLDPFDPLALAYPWRHPDPDVDRLQQEVAALVSAHAEESRAEVFERVHDLAVSYLDSSSDLPPRSAPVGPTRTPPYFTEPWYCCAEPTEGQAALL
jgi:hypothetical protein